MFLTSCTFSIKISIFLDKLVPFSNYKYIFDLNFKNQFLIFDKKALCYKTSGVTL